MRLGTVDACKRSEMALSHWADWFSEPSRKIGLAGGEQLSNGPLVWVSAWWCRGTMTLKATFGALKAVRAFFGF